MNTHSQVKRILCYGDSITWGKIPGDDNDARFSRDIRWTGVLQNLLGAEYEIIEEGLNGRTTDRESPHGPGKNGAEYLGPCLKSHSPVDMVVLFLGKNDLKAKYNATPESIAGGVEKCIYVIEKEGKTKASQVPSMILVSPPIIEEQERLRFGKKEVDFLGAHEKSKKLGGLYKAVAEQHDAEFLDLSTRITVSDIDGVHADENAHRIIAESIQQIITKLLQG
ncbi:MAG: SGNH/GDSL hydrolase family protein [Patescibacteria group bacterium]